MGVRLVWAVFTWTTVWVCWGDGQVRGASPPAPPPVTVPPQQHGVTSKGRGHQAVRVKRKAADSTQLWPDALVPYSFLSPEPERKVVLEGLKHWEERTCLRFLPANDTDLPHLQFRRLSGCRSGVGIEGAAGQNISIGDNCNKVGIVVHEVGHAVGLYHEIRRPDRDQHVVVNEANILPHELYNFYKLHWLDVTVKYDLSSVMHYHTLEWSANGRTTVATRDPMLQGVLGGWKRASSLGLSHRDAFLANHIYGCLEEWLGKCGLKRNPCKNDGYLGSSCTCVCPPGTVGRTCGTVQGGYYKHLESPCSQKITYPTTLTSPHYPSNYEADTWCVYRVEAPECQAPEVTVLDLQLGPRDHREHCYTDYLEVRNASLYDGFLVCGSEVSPGTVWRAGSSTLILYFRGEVGGFRGFRVSITFASIPGCCRSYSNTSSSPTYYLHSPGYPAPVTDPFTCSYSIPEEAPARVVVQVKFVWGKGGPRAASHDPTCALTLCQPHGRCRSFCHLLEAPRRKRKKRRRRRGKEEEEEDEEEERKVILPNVGSFHMLQHPPPPLAPHLAERGAALQVAFTLEESPCHQSLFVNRSDPRGWIGVGPRAVGLLQCEWLITAPRGTHVKVTVERLHLPEDDNEEEEEEERKERGERDSYLSVNEAGEASFPPASTRVLRGGRKRRRLPQVFVSLHHAVRIAFQGAAPRSALRLRYQLYECGDDNSECRYWAAEGECDANPLWMAPNCRKACRKCEFSATCEDQHSDCAFWAKHDQCRENELWMAVHCRRSCGHCEACQDNNRRCGRWASEGECKGNREYMRVFCPLSCGDCELPDTTTTTTTTASITTATAIPTTTTATANTTAATTTTATAAFTTLPRPAGRNRGSKERVNGVYEDNETTRGISGPHKIRKKGKRMKNPRFLKPGRAKLRKTGRKGKENAIEVLRTSPRSHVNETKGRRGEENEVNGGRNGDAPLRATVEEESEEDTEEDEIAQNQEETEDAISPATPPTTSTANSLTPEGAEDPLLPKENVFLKDLIRNQHLREGNDVTEGSKNNDVTEESDSHDNRVIPSPTTTPNDLTTTRGATTSWRRRRRRHRRRKNRRKKGRQWRRDGGNRSPQKVRKWRKEGNYHRGGRRGEEGRKSGGRGKERRRKRRRKDAHRRGIGRLNSRDSPVTASPPVTQSTPTTTTTSSSPALPTPASFTRSSIQKTRNKNSTSSSDPPLTSYPFSFSSSITSSSISSLTLTVPPPTSSPSTSLPSPPSLPPISPSPKPRHSRRKHSQRRHRNRLLHPLQKDKRGKPRSSKEHRTPQPHRVTPTTPPQGPETQQEANKIRDVGRAADGTSKKMEILPWVPQDFSRNGSLAFRSERGQEGMDRRSRSEQGQLVADAGRRRSTEERQKMQKSYAEWGIGPTRSVHRPRVTPAWRFRKGFYRRGEHVYEDDHP